MRILKERGITLVALVITIIVLLILAGVTLSLVLGDNGIIPRANESKEETIKAQVKEEIERKILEYRTIHEGEFNLEEFFEDNNLLEGFIKNNEEYSLISNGYKFYIDENENIIDGELPDGYNHCDYVTNGILNYAHGNAVINTGILPSRNYVINFKYKLNGNPRNATYKWVSLWGCGDVETGSQTSNMRASLNYNDNDGYTLITRASSNIIFRTYLNDYPDLTWDTLYEYIYDIPTNTLILNGNTIPFESYTYDTLPNRTMLVGAAQSCKYTDGRLVNLETVPNMRIYGWQVRNGNTIVQFLVPCYKDGIGYMYDLISKTMFESWKNNNGKWVSLTADLGYGFD